MRNLLFLLFLLAGNFVACKHPDSGLPADNGIDTASAPGYPVAIGSIIKQKCLGCHNAENAAYSGNLRLDTWDYLMAGGGVGPDVIPYHLENSVLLQYINTYPDLGLQLQPTMPISGVPLTHEQVKLFQDWVKNGAPNKDGYVAFSSNPDTRQKIYLTMQGCDLLGVIDAETRMLMRMIFVGKEPGVESPHCVRVDAAGRYAYVCCKDGNFIQKIDTRTDKIVGEINMRTVRNENPSWETLTLSEDGSRFIVSYYSTNGGAYIINTATMALEAKFDDQGGLSNPHAFAANSAFDTFRITAPSGNSIYKLIAQTRDVQPIPLSGTMPPATGSCNPHEIIMLPGGSAYAVSCQGSNEVRVLDARTDQLLHVIPVGTYPQELALSTSRPYLFVTCTEDQANPTLASKGSVYVIDYRTLAVVKAIYGPFWQPHGMAIDDRNGTVYVASQNEGSGIPSHHASSCDGPNGFYHVIDLETLSLTRNTRYEVSYKPYSAAVRFKN